MKLLPLETLLSMSAEQLDKQQTPIFVRQIKAQGELELAQIESDIFAKEAAITKSMATKDIKFATIIAELNALALLERKRDQYAEILVQLFPTKRASVAKAKKVAKVTKKAKK